MDLHSPGFNQRDPTVWRTLACLVLTIVFAGGLVGNIPFWLAAFLFVFVFVTVFEWQGTNSGKEIFRSILSAAILASVASAAITLVFRYGFLVKLP